MTTRLVAPAATALALMLCGSAAAAQIQTDRTCYASPASGTVALTVTAAGLDPAQPFTVTIDGAKAGSGQTDATGAATSTVSVRRLTSSHDSATHSVVLTEGANTLTTTFGVARVHAAFSPSAGDPSALRVRFSATGFALQTANPTVYVHEVDPGGRAVRSFSIGRATGPCGTIAGSARRKLFATHPRAGTWHLQFDTNRAYHRPRASMLYYRLAVTVSSRTGR